ncbi:MAG: DHHA1 domain-containing protein [Candidatus Micrarchaeota archaeon]
MPVLVTHTDFDGLACAVLVSSVEDVAEVRFTEPWLVQHRKVDVPKGAIISDLPWHPNASLWFDHHASVHPPEKFEGKFDPAAKSAARVVLDYYENPWLSEKFSGLVDAADQIDSARLSEDEVLNPQGYYLLSVSLDAHDSAAASFNFRRRLIDLLRKKPLEQVLSDEAVREACDKKLSLLRKVAPLLKEHTRVDGHVAIVDFRSAPSWLENAGGRFIVYLQNRGCVASLRVRNSSQQGMVDLSVGNNVFSQGTPVDLGALMKEFKGGGHHAAAGATVPEAEADAAIAGICARVNAAAKQ